MKFDDQTHALYGAGCQAMAATLRAWMEGAGRVSAWQLNMFAATMTGNTDPANLLAQWTGFSKLVDRHGQPDLKIVRTGPGVRRPLEAVSGANEPLVQSLRGPNGSASLHTIDHGMVQKPGRVPLSLVGTAASVSEGRAMGERMQYGSAQEHRRVTSGRPPDFRTLR